VRSSRKRRRKAQFRGIISINADIKHQHPSIHLLIFAILPQPCSEP
jgi:hypothetical protein